MKQKIILIVVLVVLVSSALVYAFTPIGRPPGSCPPLSWTLGYPGTNPIPFNIVVVGGSPPGFGTGSGIIGWCIYGNFGFLKAQYLTNRILGGLASSSNGSYVVASGYQIAPGPAGVFVNGAIYLFNVDGKMLWNLSTTNPIFEVHISTNGSIIIADNPQLLYINNVGNVLWNYTKYEVSGAELVEDGGRIVTAIDNIPFSNDVNWGCAVTMFSDRGIVQWSYTIHNCGGFEGPGSLAVSGSHIAAATSLTGLNGTIYFLDLNGNVLWSQHINSAVLALDFTNNSSHIVAETNFGKATFDLTGKLISNETS